MDIGAENEMIELATTDANTTEESSSGAIDVEEHKETRAIHSPQEDEEYDGDDEVTGHEDATEDSMKEEEEDEDEEETQGRKRDDDEESGISVTGSDSGHPTHPMDPPPPPPPDYLGPALSGPRDPDPSVLFGTDSTRENLSGSESGHSFPPRSPERSPLVGCDSPPRSPRSPHSPSLVDSPPRSPRSPHSPSLVDSPPRSPRSPHSPSLVDSPRRSPSIVDSPPRSPRSPHSPSLVDSPPRSSSPQFASLVEDSPPRSPRSPHSPSLVEESPNRSSSPRSLSHSPRSDSGLSTPQASTSEAEADSERTPSLGFSSDQQVDSQLSDQQMDAEPTQTMVDSGDDRHASDSTVKSVTVEVDSDDPRHLSELEDSEATYHPSDSDSTVKSEIQGISSRYRVAMLMQNPEDRKPNPFDPRLRLFELKQPQTRDRDRDRDRERDRDRDTIRDVSTDYGTTEREAFSTQASDAAASEDADTDYSVNSYQPSEVEKASVEGMASDADPEEQAKLLSDGMSDSSASKKTTEDMESDDQSRLSDKSEKSDKSDGKREDFPVIPDEKGRTKSEPQEERSTFRPPSPNQLDGGWAGATWVVVKRRGRPSKRQTALSGEPPAELWVPRPPKKMNAYAVFHKTQREAIAMAFPDLSAQDVNRKLSSAWKNLEEDQRQPFMELSGEENRAAMDEWEKGAEARNKLRLHWCAEVGIPESSPWSAVEKIYRERGFRGMDTSGPNKRRKKNLDNVMENAKFSQSRKLKTKIKRGTSWSKEEGDEETLRRGNSFSFLNDDKKHDHSNGGGGGGSASTSGGSGGMGKKLRLTSATGDSQWANCWRPHARKRGVLRGLDKIFSMGQKEENFDLFGNDIIQCFYDVATVTGEPVRARALMYVEQLAHRWKHTVMHKGWKQGDRPTPQEVIDAIIGMYCLERVGIHHDVKQEVQAFIESQGSHTAKDYLGWDPVSESPPKSLPDLYTGDEIGAHRVMSNSLIHTFYADRVGLTLGCSYKEVFKWLPQLRPYKGPKDLGHEAYTDQCYLVTHIVFTLNNWGELRIEPQLLSHEYYFIREHLSVQIRNRDVHLVGEFIECLRAFGATDNDPHIRAGITFLLEEQEEDGSWDKGEDRDDYTTYHATMVGVQALLAHSYRGAGPGITELGPLLKQWFEEEQCKKADLSLLPKEEMEEDKKSTNSEKKASTQSKNGASSPTHVAEIEELRFPTWQLDDRVSQMDRIISRLKMQHMEDDLPLPESYEGTGAKNSSGYEKMEGGSSDSPASIETSVMTLVRQCRSRLKVETDAKNWSAAAKLLKKLSHYDVSLEVLQETNIGKLVNKLRKAPSSKVATLAKTLVANWRQLVVEKNKDSPDP